jgi:integrase
MRLMEGMRLRVKDIDFDRLVIMVREATGGKDRVVMLPRSLAAALRRQMLAARALLEGGRQTAKPITTGLKRRLRWRRSPL